jgi:hypothetical protein
VRRREKGGGRREKGEGRRERGGRTGIDEDNLSVASRSDPFEVRCVSHE